MPYLSMLGSISPVKGWWISFIFCIQFLASLHLMDYSLIVGIHDCDRADMESAEMNQRVKETEEDSNEEENGVDEDINGLIFQLYHGENKLIFNEMIMRSALY
jgi:hypothetical protein